MSPRVHRLECSQRIPRRRDEVFAFFADASNLEAITPPFLRFRVLSAMPIEMRPGASIDYALSLGGVPLRWRTRIAEREPRESTSSTSRNRAPMRSGATLTGSRTRATPR